jgi:hypothetical protein
MKLIVTPLIVLEIIFEISVPFEVGLINNICAKFQIILLLYFFSRMIIIIVKIDAKWKGVASILHVQ